VKIPFFCFVMVLQVFCLPLKAEEGGQTPLPQKGALSQRIVSLSPVLTEELFLLGVGDSVVGRTRYCTKPAETDKIEVVGNLTEINVEKIVSLRPDLVLVIPLTDPRAKQKLRSLGIRVEEFPEAADFRGICDSFLRLAGMVHKEKAAADLIEKAKREVSRIRQETGSRQPPAVFIEVGADPLVTMVKGSYFHDLIEFSGGVNIAAEAVHQLYSREKVLAKDPDIIIIVSMGFDGEEEKRIWQGYPGLKAVRQGKIILVDSDLFCAPTPVSFVHALQGVEKILHAEN